MAKHKVADIIVEVLQSAGVQRCYGVVGDTLNHVTDAIRRSEIDWVHMRHEEVGAFVAGAGGFHHGSPYRLRRKLRSWESPFHQRDFRIASEQSPGRADR
jgi:hypothetical protein